MHRRGSVYAKIFSSCICCCWKYIISHIFPDHKPVEAAEAVQWKDEGSLSICDLLMLWPMMSTGLVLKDPSTRQPLPLRLRLLLDLTHVKLMRGGHWSVKKWDNTRNKCQKHSHLWLPLSATIFFLVHICTRGQAFKLKRRVKSKGPSCYKGYKLHESRVSQAHRWKGLASSLQGNRGTDCNGQPYHSSQRVLLSPTWVLQYSSTTWHVISSSSRLCLSSHGLLLLYLWQHKECKQHP